VYDMYPWDARCDGPRRLPAPRGVPDTGIATGLDLATHAVQVALDRRDNGGDSTDLDTNADIGADIGADGHEAAAAVASHGRK
jgi:hypothetical protein